MPLNSSWWAVNGPFADNATGSITAQVMRQFASDINFNASAAEWFEFRPSLYVLSADYESPDISQTLWFYLNTGDPATFKPALNVSSAPWAHVTDPSSRSVFLYKGDTEMMVYVSFTPSILNLTNVRVGTKITPVAALTASESVEPVYSGNTQNVWSLDKVQTATATSESFDLNFGKQLRLPPGIRAVRLGVRLTPPAGGSIKSTTTSAFSASLDLKALVVARFALPA